MTYNKETAVKEALSWQHRATYSMQWDLRDGKQADGTTYFDCSVFVYYVLNKAGAWDNSYLKRSHYTGTLKQDLTNAGWVEVDGNYVSKGDVFIWGGIIMAQAPVVFPILDCSWMMVIRLFIPLGTRLARRMRQLCRPITIVTGRWITNQNIIFSTAQGKVIQRQ